MPGSRRIVAMAIVGMMWLLSPAHAAGKPIKLWDVDFDKDKRGEAPETAEFLNSENKHPQSLKTSNENTVTVVKECGGLKDEPAKLEKKGTSVPYTPNITLGGKPNTIKRGHVRFEWKSSIESFTAGEKWPGFETLIAFNLRGNEGQTIFTVSYVVHDKDKVSGQFRCKGVDGAVGKWRRNQPNEFKLDIDLDRGVYWLDIDGKEVAEQVEVQDLAQAIRIIEYRDGTAFGAYDGQFVGAVDDIEVTLNPRKKPKFNEKK